jgi:hypothetical protein
VIQLLLAYHYATRAALGIGSRRGPPGPSADWCTPRACWVLALIGYRHVTRS